MSKVIISPKTGQRVLVFQTPSHKHVMRDIGKGVKNTRLNSNEGDMVNYVTLENYGKVQPIKIKMRT
jgi:hypothetical protein